MVVLLRKGAAAPHEWTGRYQYPTQTPGNGQWPHAAAPAVRFLGLAGIGGILG